MSYAEVAGTVLLLALAVAFWCFTVLYFFTARWEQSVIGRGLFTFSLACALLLSLGVVRMVLPEHPALLVARVCLYAAILVVVVRLTVLLVRTQWAARRARRDPISSHSSSPEEDP